MMKSSRPCGCKPRSITKTDAITGLLGHDVPTVDQHALDRSIVRRKSRLKECQVVVQLECKFGVKPSREDVEPNINEW